MMQSSGAGQSQGDLPFEVQTPSAGAAAHALAAHALPAEPGAWDEMRTGQGQGEGEMRSLWQRFAQAMPTPASGLDMATELNRRAGMVKQRIRLDGVTHNVHSDAAGGGVAARPWSLELLPLMIEAKDWSTIVAGVTQRAELLERMLTDLYGAQQLLKKGLMPSALLLRHKGWLRPMVGAQPAGGQRLLIVAFDIARGPDGRWWLVAQRTQGPSGLGYVLHNRLVIARQFPDAFRELRVQRIAASYRRLLDALEQRAAQVAGSSTPRVVLLTPGPYSETYFEHAYLARYLGLPLVEGGDLTVRGQRLFLKTVEGLEPVHGVLRRLDDDWCDPLELRPDSSLGVPGLVQAARSGSVVMANALGSAFLDSPAIQGFLPGIARNLMGQELSLPALPTWWCGEQTAWDDVRDVLADKIVRRTYPRGGRATPLHERAEAALAEDPEAWTVQGRLRFSRAPIWDQGSLSARPARVRVYAIAEGDGRWHVLPGGMTRVSSRDETSASMQRGGTSLDTWVLTDGPVDSFSMLPQRLQVDDIQQRSRPVSSRTAENLFWLGRYTERTEQLVRLAQSTLTLIDTDTEAPAALWQALQSLAERTGLAAWRPAAELNSPRSPQALGQAVLAALGDLTGSATGSASIAFNLAALERTALGLRDRLSPEQWGLMRSLGEGFARALQVEVGGAPGAPALSQALPALDRLALQLAALTGTQTDRMTRDHGWRLLAVGRLLERLQGLTLRMQIFVEAQALDSLAGVELLLDLFDSIITFRARYQRHEDMLALIDLLVLDSANPRAFAGVLRRLRTELSKLPGDADALEPLQALLPAQGAGLTLQSLRGAGDAEMAQRMLAVSGELLAASTQLAERLGERYFTLAQGLDQRV